MKNVNKLASLILAALMLCLSVFGVSAAEIIGETLDMIIMGGAGEQEELMPMMTDSCIPPQPTSITTWSEHAIERMMERNLGVNHLTFIFSDAQPVWNATHGTWNYSDGETTICVTSEGVVTTVFWNYDK